MDKNLTLSFGFKGQLKLKAQAVPLQEGYLKVGGIVAATETNGLAFGKVVSAAPATADTFTAGIGSGNVIRGICVFDDAIAQNAPAHPNTYLPGFPCAAINHGFLWLNDWTKTATSATDPVIGCKVIAKDADGTIEFLASTGSAPTGWTELTNASVRDVDPDNGALIYLD